MSSEAAARRRQRMQKLRGKSSRSEDFEYDSGSSSTLSEELKKQQRMIRNRESAAASRKRKRDEVELLKQRVAELERENAELRLRCQAIEVEAGDAAAQQELPSYCSSPVSGATDDGSLLSSDEAELFLFGDQIAQAPHSSYPPAQPVPPQPQHQQQPPQPQPFPLSPQGLFCYAADASAEHESVALSEEAWNLLLDESLFGI